MRSDVERTGGDVLSAGCGVLFGLPFALGGLLVAYGVLQQLGQGAWKDALVGSIYALIFGGIGFGMIILSVRSPLKGAPALEASAPDEPWRWRRDWATGRIVSTERQDLRLSWGCALAWNLLSSYLLFVIPDELRSGNRTALVGLLFPLAGIAMIVAAVKATVRWRRFGVSKFHMAETPAAIGGQLRGWITSDRLPADATSIKLRLSCLRHERHHRSSRELTIWEAEKTLTADAMRSTSRIPVVFDIPAHCEPASPRPSSPSYVSWRLQATAAIPGVDYAPQFDVPVFRTG